MLLVSCGGSGGGKKGGGTKRFTSKTGWKPNDQKGWFFTGKQQKQKGWPGMVYVEGGTFTKIKETLKLGDKYSNTFIIGSINL